LPPGKKLLFDLTSIQNQAKKDIFTIKEGVEYRLHYFSFMRRKHALISTL